MLTRGRIHLVLGDITKQRVDAIVNAANSSLMGGGGVDGAIHHAAGKELLAECRALGGCPTGEARITKGCKLPAKYVIHTVGPVWHGGKYREAEQLANCYRSTFALATQHEIRSIALPSVSTGAYGYPVEDASVIAVRETRDFLANNTSIESVTFVCYDRWTYDAYEQALNQFE